MGKGQRARLAASRERWRILTEGIHKAETEIETRVLAASPPVLSSPSPQSVAVMESVEHFPALPTCETSLPKKENEEKEKDTEVEHVPGADISETTEKHDENKVDTTDKNAEGVLIIEGDEIAKTSTAMTDEKTEDTPASTASLQRPATLAADREAQSNTKKQRARRKRKFKNQRDRLKKKMENSGIDAAETAPTAATTENRHGAEAGTAYSTQFASLPFQWQYEQLRWAPLYPAAAYPATYQPTYPPYLSTYAGLGARRNAVSQSSVVANMTGPTTHLHYPSPFSGQCGMARRHFLPQTSGAANMNHNNIYSGLGGTARHNLLLPPPGFGNANQHSPRRNRRSRFFPRERATENRNSNQAAAAESAQSADLRATAPAFVPNDEQT